MYKVQLTNNEIETIKEALKLAINWDEKEMRKYEIVEDYDNYYYQALKDDWNKNRSLLHQFQELPM